jgi:DNA topoisomerase IB
MSIRNHLSSQRNLIEIAPGQQFVADTFDLSAGYYSDSLCAFCHQGADAVRAHSHCNNFDILTEISFRASICIRCCIPVPLAFWILTPQAPKMVPRDAQQRDPLFQGEV